MKLDFCPRVQAPRRHRRIRRPSIDRPTITERHPDRTFCGGRTALIWSNIDGLAPAILVDNSPAAHSLLIPNFGNLVQPMTGERASDDFRRGTTTAAAMPKWRSGVNA